MADDYVLIPNGEEDHAVLATTPKPPRVASLDVFRGLCIFRLDYSGDCSPWNGLHLADFVMPFFLFIAGVSLALVYKVLMAGRSLSNKRLDWLSRYKIALGAAKKNIISSSLRSYC